MRLSSTLLIASVFLTGSLALADDIVGAIWNIEYIKDDRDPMRIRCLKSGKVLGPAGKEIGNWKQDGAVKALITITASGNRNGKYEIIKLGKNPPSFQGQYTDAHGKKVNVKVKLVKD